MNTRLFSAALVSSFFALAPLHADDKPVAAASPAPTVAPSTTWDKSGILSPEDIIASLGIAPTPEQRRAIEDATRRRNIAIALANAKFSEELGITLKTTDTELATKLQDEKERRRLERMRMYQPSRYQALKNKKK